MSHPSNKQHQKNKMIATPGKNKSKQEDLGGLEEMFSKLNPTAKEFVPSRHNRGSRQRPSCSSSSAVAIISNATTSSRKKGNKKEKDNGNGKRSMNSRTGKAQNNDAIKRTVHVSELHHLVTEAQLAGLFVYCGQVVDCRVCGDPKSSLRFAFVEFSDLEGAQNALTLSGTMIGSYPIKVLPSKTAIAPVNPDFLPKSEEEMEVCARTIYCTNIDKKVSKSDLKFFFESYCGEVYRMRMLDDPHHHRRIAFVEFAMAESAAVALTCSGALLGSFPIRVSPSKTAVRPRSTRPTSAELTVS